jgi:hypothetical protein
MPVSIVVTELQAKQVNSVLNEYQSCHRGNATEDCVVEIQGCQIAPQAMVSRDEVL